MLTVISCEVAALAIAALYYLYRDGYLNYRHRRMRDRVTFMLWSAALRG